MAIASMVIGIVSMVLGFYPLSNWISVFPALVGLIFGIADVSRRPKPGRNKGRGIAGVILNASVIMIVLLWTLFFATAVSEEVFDFFGSFK